MVVPPHEKLDSRSTHINPLSPQASEALSLVALNGSRVRQVVELPREKPEAALKLFADVAGLRLLVVGGDGTVGWVLSCVDRLAEEKKGAAAERQAAAAQRRQVQTSLPETRETLLGGSAAAVEQEGVLQTQL